MDPKATAKDLTDWISCFAFTALSPEWVCVIPAQPHLPWLADPRISAAERQYAAEVEATLRQQATASQTETAVHVRIGNPTRELLDYADTVQAELVVARATNKKPLPTLFVGSVARGLVEGATQSVLLARGPAPAAPLRLLVATDHSDYAENALKKLVDWAPQGIGQLTLLHILPPPFKAGVDHLAQEIAHEAYGRPIRTPEAVTATAARALGAALHLPETAVASCTRTGTVAHVIQETLDETGADLLVLGAKGHSLLERLSLGSVSFWAATACPKTVLVLRA